jgi:hypothetical protein
MHSEGRAQRPNEQHNKTNQALTQLFYVTRFKEKMHTLLYTNYLRTTEL